MVKKVFLKICRRAISVPKGHKYEKLFRNYFCLRILIFIFTLKSTPKTSRLATDQILRIFKSVRIFCLNLDPDSFFPLFDL